MLIASNTVIQFLIPQRHTDFINTRPAKFSDFVTKGTFHAKIGTIKDRNGMDLTEAEGTKKRWQDYAEELYKKKYS